METASAVFWVWAEQLGRGDPEYLFLNPLATPIFSFPLWVEQSLSESQDKAFQYELAYASIALHFYVRLLDDAMDGHIECSRLLPVLTSLYAHSYRSLQSLFPPDDPFWNYFYELTDLSADATIADFTATSLTSQDFIRFAAQKSYCVLIPMIAVLCRYKSYADVDRWLQFWHAFAPWNQMRDDVFDWYSDRKNNLCTYLLSEAERRKREDESVEHWMLRDGYEWSLHVLDSLFKRVRQLAAELNCPEMEQHLEERYQKLDRDIRHLTETLRRMDREIGRVLDGHTA